MRNYDGEYQDNALRQYAYDFDAVVRRYMMRTLSPYFSNGKALELGCFEGESTQLLSEIFRDLSVVEASKELIAKARARVSDEVLFINSTIEAAQLQPVYDSIFLVHTLEHLDAPVESLSHIRRWLSPAGRLFVVVPNANAASRQIAVKMGIVETNHSVTPGELLHGHRCTYSLDSLENDARKSGLSIEARGGIFFKPFANFQFDALIEKQIIDQAYLDGCYALGMQYPDLTASVYVICRRD